MLAHSGKFRTLRENTLLGVSLCAVGGFMNAGGLVVVGIVISHVTGHWTKLGRDVALAKWDLVFDTGAWLACFLGGAMLSTFIIETRRTERLRRIYVRPLLLELVLLGLFAVFGSELVARSPAWQTFTTGWLCFCMGLQNALVSRVTGGVVRGTHMTGVLTDLGIELVRFAFTVRDRCRAARATLGRLGVGTVLREVRAAAVSESTERLRLFSSMLGSFFLGAILGTLAFVAWGSAGAVPALIALLALVLRELRELRREIARERELGPTSLPALFTSEPARGTDTTRVSVSVTPPVTSAASVTSGSASAEPGAEKR